MIISSLQSRYIVRSLKVDEYEKWDNFVDESPQGTVFHKSYWLKASGKRFKIYGCFKGGNLVAGFPIVSRLRFGIKCGVHPYLTPYLGILFKENKTKYISRMSEEKNMSRVIAKKIKEDFGKINFSFSPLIVDLQPFIWEGFSSSVKYTYLLNLTDLEKVWEDMGDSRRNDIRRAEKDKISIELSDNFEKTFALVEKTFQRQKIKPTFRADALTYNEVLKHRKQCQAFLAKDKKGDNIAVVYIVWDSKRSYYLLGGYDPKKRHHGVSALAMWEAIKFTKERLGLNEFDFEGSMIQPVEQYFRKFGGKLTPYYSVAWIKPFLKVILSLKKMVGSSLRKLR